MTKCNKHSHYVMCIFINSQCIQNKFSFYYICSKKTFLNVLNQKQNKKQKIKPDRPQRAAGVSSKHQQTNKQRLDPSGKTQETNFLSEIRTAATPSSQPEVPEHQGS